VHKGIQVFYTGAIVWFTHYPQTNTYTHIPQLHFGWKNSIILFEMWI